MDQGISWPQQLRDESLVPASNDNDFSDLLEFGMHFPDLDNHGQDNSVPNTVAGSESVRMDTDMSYNALMDNVSFDDAINQFNNQSQGLVQSPYSNANIGPGFYSYGSSQQQLSHKLAHQPMHQHASSQPTNQPVIPPTPNSVEFHGNAARYPQRVDTNSELYDQYAPMNEEQALYTPLISPAMTPLDNQFRLPEYTVPGEYITPLTSPAIAPQNSSSSGYPAYTSQPSDVGYVRSPADAPLPASAGPPSPGITRKQRPRPSANKQAGRSKHKSPAVRPQTRRKSAINANSDEVLNGLGLSQNGAQAQGLSSSSNENSGQDSVSPDALSEPLMPPPALPAPKQSPAVKPQFAPQAGGAATPATLMRIQPSQQSHNQTAQANQKSGELHDDVMEDIALPEAATPTTQLSQSRTPRIHKSSSTSTTPSLLPKAPSADKTPSSIAPSPSKIAIPSPSGSVGKKDPASRKRQSLSSQPSPQLRPKISPNIQPMTQTNDAGMSTETSALYLASKSNYQHILDGTHLPGVSYPETLAENLSSKRTNHKLAEQGRRNRINHALKEIETLIPQEFVNVKNAKEAAAAGVKSSDKEKEKAASQSASKASTVELAIDYIKALQCELEETKGKLTVAEGRLNDASDSTST